MIQRVDGLRFVREHPQMFLRRIPARAEELAGALVEAVALTARAPVELRRSGDRWWIVDSAEDWVSRSGPGVSEIFSRIVAFPEAGQNSMRPEVLLRAFAEDLVTVGPEGRQVISGSVESEDPIWGELESVSSGGRAVAFRLSDTAPALTEGKSSS